MSASRSSSSFTKLALATSSSSFLKSQLGKPLVAASNARFLIRESPVVCLERHSSCDRRNNLAPLPQELHFGVRFIERACSKYGACPRLHKDYLGHDSDDMTPKPGVIGVTKSSARWGRRLIPCCCPEEAKNARYGLPAKRRPIRQPLDGIAVGNTNPICQQRSIRQVRGSRWNSLRWSSLRLSTTTGLSATANCSMLAAHAHPLTKDEPSQVSTGESDKPEVPSRGGTGDSVRYSTSGLIFLPLMLKFDHGNQGQHPG